MELEETQQQNRVNFVPCLKWVSQGKAKSNPEKVQLSKDELVKIIQETKERLEESENAAETSTAQGDSMTVDEEFRMENYDEDDDTTTLQQLGIQSIAELPSNAEENFSDDDSEKDDDLIKADDNLVLVGRVDGDASILEVYVYNNTEGSLYCHHDLFLPAFPLCMEWLDFEPGEAPGNYCAIGSMDPIIDIWDLDIVNCMEPAYRLGRKGSKKKNVKRVGHTDAVMDLSWNRNYHHVMASGSVDQTVLLWDIEKGEPSTTLKSFSDKVQCVEWHKLEGYTLLTGSCDKKVRVFDCRDSDKFLSWDLSGEAERVLWNPTQPFTFVVGTSEGIIEIFDCRKGLLWSDKVHDKEITGLTFSTNCEGLLVTAGGETIKVWDVGADCKPTLVHEREAKMGSLHCLEMSPDLPFILAVGGDNKSKNFSVFNLMNYDLVKQRFESKLSSNSEMETTEGTSANG